MSQALEQTQHLILSLQQAPEIDLQAHFTDEVTESWQNSYSL